MIKLDKKFTGTKVIKHVFKTSLPVLGLTLMLTGCHNTFDGALQHQPTTTKSHQHEHETRTANPRPTLVVTNEPVSLVDRQNAQPTQIQATVVKEVKATTPKMAMNRKSGAVETLVSRKIHELSNELITLQQTVLTYDERLSGLRAESMSQSESYYRHVAAISAQLQSGTTPGNPLLIEEWNISQEHLNSLAQSAVLLNDLATEIAREASKSAFLLESTRATFGLSGAVQEDHDNLIALEDDVNQTIVRINRLLNTVNDEVNRRTSYLRSERLNMQTLSLAIANGELYGQNISNRLFMRAASAGASAKDRTPPQASKDGSLIGRRPLVIIRFDKENIDYEQDVYNALSKALEKKPSALFDLVAVSPSRGNAAESSLAASAARKNGEKVLRSLTHMGLPMERITLNAASSNSAVTSEVHLYVR